MRENLRKGKERRGMENGGKIRFLLYCIMRGNQISIRFLMKGIFFPGQKVAHTGKLCAFHLFSFPCILVSPAFYFAFIDCRLLVFFFFIDPFIQFFLSLHISKSFISSSLFHSYLSSLIVSFFLSFIYLRRYYPCCLRALWS